LAETDFAGIVVRLREALEAVKRGEDIRPILEVLDGLEPVVELCRQILTLYAQIRAIRYGTAIQTPEDAAEILRPAVLGREKEVSLVLPLDRHHRPLTPPLFVQGGDYSVEMRLAEILQPVLRAGAPVYIIAHTHPGGKLDPSDADWSMTWMLVERGVELGILLLDHLIFTPQGDHLSMRRLNDKENRIPWPEVQV